MTDRGRASSAPPIAAPPPETLFVATALAPTVYSRNRMFSLFKDPVHAAARKRGQLVRSVARDWLRAQKGNGGIVTRWSQTETGFTLWYRIPALHLDRTLELSPLERACLLYLLERGKAEGVELSREERSAVERALAKLVA